jgi:hypothetical protein
MTELEQLERKNHIARVLFVSQSTVTRVTTESAELLTDGQRARLDDAASIMREVARELHR